MLEGIHHIHSAPYRGINSANTNMVNFCKPGACNIVNIEGLSYNPSTVISVTASVSENVQTRRKPIDHSLWGEVQLGHWASMKGLSKMICWSALVCTLSGNEAQLR